MRFWPDPKYFDSPQIVVADIAALLRAKAMLLPGVKFTLGVEKKGKIETQTWHFPEGIKGYFATAVAGLEPVAETFLGERYIAAQSESDSFAEGEGAMWAIAWTPEGDVVAESYVNMIPTRARRHARRRACARACTTRSGISSTSRDGPARPEDRARRTCGRAPATCSR